MKITRIALITLCTILLFSIIAPSAVAVTPQPVDEKPITEEDNECETIVTISYNEDILMNNNEQTVFVHIEKTVPLCVIDKDEVHPPV